MSKISEFVSKALESSEDDGYKFGYITNRLCLRIAEVTGTRVLHDANTIITSSAVRHAFVRHGGETEKDRTTQQAITAEDFEYLFDITRNPDNIQKGDKQGRKRDDIIIFSKKIKGKNYFVLMNADRSQNPASLYFNTMYIRN